MGYNQGTRPQISKELVEYLERLYPVEIPDVESSLQEIYFNAGRADVARRLRELYEKQEAVINE